MKLLFFFLPIIAFASMLSDADAIGQKYSSLIAKNSPPSSTSQMKKLLSETTSWLSIDLRTLAGSSVLETLGSDPFWQILQDIGIDGVQILNLKEGGAAREGFEIDPKWGRGWVKIAANARGRGIALIGELIGSSTGVCADFEMALKNIAGYPELYHLIEIDPKDWSLLPKVAVGTKGANISWLELDSLDKKGYVPESSRALVKESAWNATAKIRGIDGIDRRWIYLKENKNDPELSWLSPTFGANRIASADALDSFFRLGQKILKFDAKMPPNAKETSSLWIRKIGGYTVANTNGTLKELQESPTDLSIDTPTRPALLHALANEDAEALRLIYDLYLQKGVAQMGLVHSLEPFVYEWSEFLLNPTQRYLYREEKITAELLRDRLIKEDVLKLKGLSTPPFSTWVQSCKGALQNPELTQKAHLLLAFTYAMQPGVFSLSLSDLIGEVDRIDPMGKNPKALYPSLPCQMQSPRSFAMQLKKILSVRDQSQIALGELASVPPVGNRGTLLLLYRLPTSRFFQLLAINFGRFPVQETLRQEGIKDTWAIDLMTGLIADKGFDTDLFSFDLPPLSGKVFLFQPKYYD
jgi:hypothetical protein